MEVSDSTRSGSLPTEGLGVRYRALVIYDRMLIFLLVEGPS